MSSSSFVWSLVVASSGWVGIVATSALRVPRARDDQPIVFFREDCQATVFASDFGAKLPQTMGGVPNGLPFVGFIDARTVDEFSPRCLLGPFEDGTSTMLALDIARCLNDMVLASGALRWLVLEQLLDELGSGGLLWDLGLKLVFAVCGRAVVELALAGFIQLLFNTMSW